MHRSPVMGVPENRRAAAEDAGSGPADRGRPPVQQASVAVVDVDEGEYLVLAAEQGARQRAVFPWSGDAQSTVRGGDVEPCGARSTKEDQEGGFRHADHSPHSSGISARATFSASSFGPVGPSVPPVPPL